MLIKNDSSHQFLFKTRIAQIKKKMGIKGFILLGLCIVLLLIINYNIFSNRTLSNSIGDKVQKYLHHIKSKFYKYPAGTKKISINIKYKDYQKLAYKRYVALKKGAHISEPDDYVPVTIEHNNKVIKAKVRLKGDLFDQHMTKKWPLRVVIKGDNTLFGMKVFSLHHPDARGYVYEWLLHEAMRREDIIALRYDFIDVSINGNHLGIYALEEHFEKRLIENNRRREGPILCFNEELDTHNIAEFGWPPHRRIDFYSAKIDVYRPTKTLNTPKLKEQFMRAKYLLEAFRRGILKTRDVFDYEILGRYFALLDIFNARHAAQYGNLKFYYNPITSKLEPIFFDAEFIGRPYVDPKNIHAEYWYKDPPGKHYSPTHLFFSDNLVFEAYLNELSRVSKSEYLDNLFKETNEKLKKNIQIINSEFPDFKFKKEILYFRQKFISKILSFPISIHPYFIKYGKKNNQKYIELKISNLRTMPIKILSLKLSDKIICQFTDNEPILNPSIPAQPADIQTIQFKVSSSFKWKHTYLNELSVQYTVLGLNTPRISQVIPWSDLDDTILNDDLINQNFNVKSLDFALIDEEKKKIYFKPGTWIIDKTYIIPEGYIVIGRNGTNLELEKSGGIISYSPFEIIGTPKQPIHFYSRDSKSQGIILINTKQQSTFRHVIFKNLSNIKQKGLDITGAVTLFEAPLTMSHCQFLNNRSEDALNIIGSKFSIDQCRFNQNYSDAIDVDFSDGIIENSIFINCGNDAIDISGSEIQVRNIQINGAGDKGLSVGEKSTMTATHLDIKNTVIGAASKDLSELIIINSKIYENKTGLAVFKKKTEFGPGTIKASDLTMMKNDIPYLVEKNSFLIVDNIIIEPNSKTQ